MTGRARLTMQAAVATFAAATALSAVFSSIDWLMPVTGAIAVVAVVNELARRSRRAAALGPLLSAAAMLLYVTWLDARHVAYAGFIPTSASLQTLADLTRSGFTDIRSLATPVPTHPGLVLLAVVGLAAVELVVDLLAVTLRRPAVAGMPLLAVFVLCTSAARHGVGWLPFVIGTGGYLWLLLADAKDRVSRWGRAIGSGAHHDDGTGPRVTVADIEAPSPLSALARRVGATAIAIGLVVPLLVPGLHGGVPKTGNGIGTGKGSSRVVTINPIVTLKSQLVSPTATPVLRMTSSDSAPGYLRLTSLDRFDGTTFSPSDLQARTSTCIHGEIHGPAVSGAGVDTKISVERLVVHWLPVPTQAEVVNVSCDWHYDAASNTIFSARSTTKHLDYTVSSIRDEPTAVELDAVGDAPQSEFASTLTLPPMSVELSVLATKITRSATTPFRRALAIQRFLDSPPFTYSTAVAPSDSANALQDFLLRTHTGFCQQYAASMAVLARMVGIPSRVAVGFTHGLQQKDGSWLVTSHDAHAWPELYFSGYGWLPFEPTPRNDGQAVSPAFAQPTGTQPSDLPPKSHPVTPSPNNGLGGKQKDLLNRLGDRSSPVPRGSTTGNGGSSPLWWVVLAVLAALLVTPSLARSVARARRRGGAHDASGRAHAAWAELRAVAIDIGLPWLDGVTPRTSARLLGTDAALDSDAHAALGTLVSAEERARYAASPGGGGADDLWHAVTMVRRGLLAERGPLARVSAIVMPRSTLRGLRVGAARVADLLDLLDVFGAKARGWLRRRLPGTA